MVFIDQKDSYRKKNGLGSKPAESMLRKSHPVFGVPMPAFGEAICKTKEKGRGSAEMLGEMSRLMDTGFIVPRFIRNPEDTYSLANRICSIKDDDRAIISAMDGLIMATAATDPECDILFTEDTRLAVDPELHDAIDSYRLRVGASPLRIGSMEELVP